jgi:hypothetical protein
MPRPPVPHSQAAQEQSREQKHATQEQLHGSCCCTHLHHTTHAHAQHQHRNIIRCNANSHTTLQYGGACTAPSAPTHAPNISRTRTPLPVRRTGPLGGAGALLQTRRKSIQEDCRACDSPYTANLLMSVTHVIGGTRCNQGRPPLVAPTCPMLILHLHIIQIRPSRTTFVSASTPALWSAGRGLSSSDSGKELK